jgi:phosphate/sulfate permease
VTHLDPYQGFAAETATAAILYTTGTVGLPVSTTHTISGSVLGAGAARSISAVRWGIVRSILLAWVVTIPCAGGVAAVMELLTRVPGGTEIVFALAVAIGAGAYLVSRRLSASTLQHAEDPGLAVERSVGAAR